jgi:hypothetical protein
MHSLFPTNTNVNYVELIRCTLGHDDDRNLVVKTTNEDDYKVLFNKTKVKYGKPFTKCFKQFSHNNLIYNIILETGEVNVYSLDACCIMKKEKNAIAIGYHKKKMSILNFPSTSYYDNVKCISRTTFRVSNRVYINFEKHTMGDEVTYHTYVNYNHDKNVDWNSVSRDIESLWNLFTS